MVSKSAHKKTIKDLLAVSFMLACCTSLLGSCAHVDTPGARNVKIPAPTIADERAESINEQPDSVLYLPLGSDVLVPEAEEAEGLPKENVGPFELRSETLAGALQLILADYEIPLAFETNEALTRTITVANLKGSLDSVVGKVCSLADLYCSFDDGLLVIKDTETFTVSVPPIGGENDIITSLATGLEAITGSAPIVDTGTRTIIYEASNRTKELADRYFQRIRTNTAMIVFEIYIWEVGLNSDSTTGIDWTDFGKIGGANISIPGNTGIVDAVSIGLPKFGDQITFDTSNVVEFLSTYGAVKTISQPQITMLSGSDASLRVAETTSYVASLTRTIDDGQVSTSTEIDSVDSGFTINLSSAWDNSTVYGTLEIQVQDVISTDSFTVDELTGSQVTVPQTAERELSTQVRIRPGDSLLIAGLVRETDQFDSSGPGFKEPILPTSRSTDITNSELVFLLRPKVIVYTSEREAEIGNRHSKVFDKGKALNKSEPELNFEYQTNFPSGTVTKEMLNPAEP